MRAHIDRAVMAGSIRFGNWVWNPNTLELRNGSHVANLEPRVARLLEYLITHPGELLSHDRIVERGLHLLFDFVQPLAGGRLVRAVHRSHLFLH